MEFYNTEKKKIRIILENKVLAAEGNDQTNMYYNYYNSIKDGSQNLYVYLSPISSIDLEELSQPECENKNFIQINYQLLLENLLEPALQQNISSKTKYVIEQYIQSLSQPSYDDNDDFTKGLIMTIGMKERTLLEKFWNANQNLIMATLYAISSDPNQDKDVRDSVTEAISTINNTGKDRSRIKIYYKGKEYTTMQKSDLGLETVRLLHNENLITNEILEWMKNDTSCSFKLIKKKNEVRETEAKYKKYRVDRNPEVTIENEDYYVARNWGINNINRLINQIESFFPDIKYEIISST